MNNDYKFDKETNLLSLKQLQENRSWFLALGITLVVLGTLAVLFSYTTTIFSVIYLGIFLIIVGLFEGIQSFTLSKWGTFFLHLFLGILYTIGGIFIVANPKVNAISLTLLLAIFLVAAGILRIIFAITKNLPHKGWLALNGVLTLILGILIWIQWPISGLWVIGMFVGLDVLFAGWTLIMLALKAKKSLK